MKRLFIILCIVVVLGTVLPGFFILAQPSKIPHENPATAKSLLDNTLLLTSYGDMFYLAGVGKYSGALDLLALLRLAEVPTDLRYAFDRYNFLSGELFARLDAGESRLNEAIALLSQNQLGSAGQKLDAARAALRLAESRLAETREATPAVGGAVGVFSSAAATELRQSYGRLVLSLEPIRQLIYGLQQSHLEVTSQYQSQVTVLIPTELSLDVSPASAFVGDDVIASGRLSSGGLPLPQRMLTLFLNGRPFRTATGADGSYAASITLPYQYVATTVLYAEYIPSGPDVNTYEASQSLPAVINSLFYPTQLDVSLPTTTYPGRSFTISGQVSSTGSDRTVTILLDGAQLAREVIGARFSLELTMPRETATGRHTLTVVAAPAGRYAGATRSQTIEVSKLAVSAEIKTPWLVIMPGELKVSGRIYRGPDPVQGASVRLGFKDAAAATSTAADGTFSAVVKAPTDLSLIGPREFTVNVGPQEPWYAALTEKGRVFGVNVLGTGVLVGLLTLGTFVYLRGRRAARLETGGRLTEAGNLAVTPLLEASHEPTGIKGKVLLAYSRGIAAVQGRVTIAMTPHTTVREFLEAAAPLLPAVFRPLAELTALAEVALYSARPADEVMVNSAEQLAAGIKKELHSETA